jgi:hypothetical protein
VLDSPRRLLRAETQRGQFTLLSTVVQSYLKLTSTEVARVTEVLEKEPELHGVEFAEAFLKQLAEERGIERGIEQGLREGGQRVLLSPLRAKFGELPETVLARVGRMSLAESEAASLRVSEAASLAETGLGDAESPSESE